DPTVANRPTADMVVWSVLSLIVLIGGTGVMFAIYGRWSKNIGWHESETPSLSFIRPSQVGLTKSQRATSWFFFVIA
ncbi:nitric-oxide reductase large subunit, partial [Xanthomonas citri pv. citri]|nr:nitric-oxide reductase large subunit [Xanthomonas citri pv. citri]